MTAAEKGTVKAEKKDDGSKKRHGQSWQKRRMKAAERGTVEVGKKKEDEGRKKRHGRGVFWVPRNCLRIGLRA